MNYKLILQISLDTQRKYYSKNYGIFIHYYIYYKGIYFIYIIKGYILYVLQRNIFYRNICIVFELAVLCNINVTHRIYNSGYNVIYILFTKKREKKVYNTVEIACSWHHN